MERARLPAWIGQRLEMQEQSADPDTLQFLADKVEGNLVAAYQELKKLALLYPAGALSFDQVKDAVLDVARYDVYKLSGCDDGGRYRALYPGAGRIAGRGYGVAVDCVHACGPDPLVDNDSQRTGFRQAAHAVDEPDQGKGRSTESYGKCGQAPSISNN